MDVICSTGFGMDVDAQRNPDNPFIKKAREFSEIKLGGNPLFLLNSKYIVYHVFLQSIFLQG